MIVASASLGGCKDLTKWCPALAEAPVRVAAAADTGALQPDLHSSRAGGGRLEIARPESLD